MVRGERSARAGWFRRLPFPGRDGCSAVIVAALMAASPAAAADAPPAGLTAPEPDAAFLAPVPLTEPVWAVTGLLGASGGGADLHVLAYKPWHIDPADHVFGGLAVSRRLARFWTDFTVEAEVGVGHRAGSGFSSNEGWAAVYFRWDGFPWNAFVKTSVAVSTGLNVIDSLPSEETRRSDRYHSQVLHYFSPELTFAAPSAPNHELLVRWHHRSGVFGLFDGVRGGSNIVSVGYRYRW